MADAARKEKLAAAKKKLKSFQKGSRTQSQPAPANRNKISNNNKSKPPDSNQIIPKVTSNGGSREESPQSTFQHTPPHTSTPTSIISNTPGSGRVDNTSHSGQNTPTSHTTNGAQHIDRINTTESTERLQQLSNQVNGLLSESSALVNDDGGRNVSVDHLEARNQELAADLSRHVQTNQHLMKQLDEMKQVNVKLQSSFDTEKRGFEDKLKRELGALKEQLQVHIQTIGILVAEKTELQSSLGQSQKQAEAKAEEIEELAGRLRASRQRVGDLERSFSTASSGKQKNEQSLKDYQKDVDRLKMELYKLNKSNEEYLQQNSELQGKLQKKVSECASLSDSLIEVKGRLEMSDLHVTQLQNGSAPQQDAHTTQEIEKLLTEKAQMQMRLDQYEEQFQRVSQERDHISQQYQEYIQQLQQQGQTLQIQINTLVEERDECLSKNRELETITEELRSTSDVAEATASEVIQARQELALKVEKMVMEVGELKHKYETQVADNSQLSRLVMEREERIMELEMNVHQLSDNQVDKEKLLDSMQSDKTALSRAMAQNKELKSQLAELQNGFVKMSNDNMELLNKHQSEQHVSKELGSRLGQQEEELKEIREQLVQKEQLLQEVQKYADVLQQQQHGDQHHQGDMDERLREFQAQTPLIETMQKELSSAQDTINALTNQNGELRSEILQSSSRDVNMNTSSEQYESMTASIRQLEMERNQIVSILQEEKEQRLEAEATLTQLRDNLANMTPATLNGDVINKAQFEALQHAMKQLEGRYTKAMRDKADLSDKTEQLEHIIMQLQGETDTIAEYITLYQTQRMLLRERQEEKDDYISRLAREREDQSDKLSQLQGLLVQVLTERRMLQDHVTTETGAAPTPNHVKHPGVAIRQQDKMAGKMDSTHLEDWPDYTSSDSDASEVESIVGGEGESASGTHTRTHSTPKDPHDKMDYSHHNSSGPTPDPTAQKIMNLLSEIGSAVYIDSHSDSYNRHFIHCTNCSGPIINV